MKTLSIFLLFLSITVNAQFTNILISNSDSPDEPAISIDPNNTNRIIAAANLANSYISLDSGLTWTTTPINSSYGVWGDFSTLIDNNGDFYVFHLSYPNTNTNDWLDRIVCQKSIDDGATFNDGSYMGLNADPLKDQDKEWITIDRNNGNIYTTWTEFDQYGSSDVTCKTRILFSKSTDNGETWSNAIKINNTDGNCEDLDLTVEGAVPAVGPNGEIYVAWAGPEGIVFNKSLDYGDTWLAHDILVDTMPGGWDFNIPGILDHCNGFPITLCDTSGGVNNGTIYVNWTDQRNGTNDTDVWLKKSTDGGITWNPIVRVNDDAPGKHQFLTWMDIDQTTGYLYVVFYDRRNHNDNMTDVYLARSIDGGNSFQNILISETPFLPNDTVFFGDYNGISAHNGVIRPIWKRLHNGNASIWTALINDNDIVGVNDYFNQFELQQNYPNPAKNETYISYKLKNSAKVSLTIYNILGEKIATIFNNELKNSGYFVEKIAFNKYNLTKGVYFYKLQIGKQTQTKKMVIK